MSVRKSDAAGQVTEVRQSLDCANSRWREKSLPMCNTKSTDLLACEIEIPVVRHDPYKVMHAWLPLAGHENTREKPISTSQTAANCTVGTRLLPNGHNWC